MERNLTFGDIMVGDFFRYDNLVFKKTGENEAVCSDQGVALLFEDDTEVRYKDSNSDKITYTRVEIEKNFEDEKYFMSIAVGSFFEWDNHLYLKTSHSTFFDFCTNKELTLLSDFLVKVIPNVALSLNDSSHR